MTIEDVVRIIEQPPHLTLFDAVGLVCLVDEVSKDLLGVIVIGGRGTHMMGSRGVIPAQCAERVDLDLEPHWREVRDQHLETRKRTLAQHQAFQEHQERAETEAYARASKELALPADEVARVVRVYRRCADEAGVYNP